MEFKIDPKAYLGIFAVPKTLAENDLRLAGATQLKAILCFLARTAEGKSPAVTEIAKFIGRDVDEVEDAMVFWTERGVLLRDDQALPDAVGPAGETPAPAAEEKTAPVISAPARRESEHREAEIAMPTHEQVAARLNESEDLRCLFAEAQQKLGKTIGYDGQSTLIYIHDSYGLPVEVILMLLEYLKTLSKTGYRSVLTTAKKWADSEIDTLEAAEEYIREASLSDETWKQFRALSLVKNERPTTKQREFFLRWKKQYGFDAAMIYRAYEVSVENTGRMSLPYMEKVLSSWKNEGIRTAGELEKAEKARAQQAAAKKPDDTFKRSGKSGKTESKTSASYDKDKFRDAAKGLKYKK